MMTTVSHVTSGLGLRKFQADGFLLTRMYLTCPDLLSLVGELLLGDGVGVHRIVYTFSYFLF